ncbi:transposase [Candidatus Tisiphia endosymbiont of Ptychoptera albimana]|uniref:transposase n=1 Tax=Candidatus Tisiphia endosymbiont of Ptychoptera albimana TaxID=3066260 RepID=UPI001D5E8F3B|nr:transposase [Rickettsia endosymbiont of Sericostoma sp. HW-2014]
MSLKIILPLSLAEKIEKQKLVYNRETYKLRGAIERFFGKIKENRRLAVRYEKDDLSFLSFIALAAIKLHLC